MTGRVKEAAAQTDGDLADLVADLVARATPEERRRMRGNMALKKVTVNCSRSAAPHCRPADRPDAVATSVPSGGAGAARRGAPCRFFDDSQTRQPITPPGAIITGYDYFDFIFFFTCDVTFFYL